MDISKKKSHIPNTHLEPQPTSLVPTKTHASRLVYFFLSICYFLLRLKWVGREERRTDMQRDA